MINKLFWAKIAENWVRSDDGIEIPDIEPIGEIIDPDLVDEAAEIDDEINDILADLGLDDF